MSIMEYYKTTEIIKLLGCPDDFTNRLKIIRIFCSTLSHKGNKRSFEYCSVETNKVYYCEWVDGFKTPYISKINYIMTLQEWIDSCNKSEKKWYDEDPNYPYKEITMEEMIKFLNIEDNDEPYVG
jgi:hypothetical protein